MIAPPQGPYPVCVRDFTYQAPGSSEEPTPKTHVVGRFFYPSTTGPHQEQAVPWIRAWGYARGYIHFSFWGARGWKAWLAKTLLTATVYITGLIHKVPAGWCGPLAGADPEEGPSRPFPVIIFSHGAAAMRNTYSAVCCELASQGLVVAAIEHADGSAAAVQLAGGQWMLFRGLGKGRVLEEKCEYRLHEAHTLVELLTDLGEGQLPEGLVVSGTSDAAALFKGRLSMQQLGFVGHSCGGATAALAAASCPQYKCAIALDPWWPLLPEGSAALTGWSTQVPLLVLGSHAWNTPDAAGRLLCDGDRQRAVLAAAAGRPLRAAVYAAAAAEGASLDTAVSSQEQDASHAAATTAATAAPAAAAAGPSSTGGGALLLVLAGSAHNTASDLPLLTDNWSMKALGAMMGLKTPRVPPQESLHSLNWGMTHFLKKHLPWDSSPDLTSAPQSKPPESAGQLECVSSLSVSGGGEAQVVIAADGAAGSADTCKGKGGAENPRARVQLAATASSAAATSAAAVATAAGALAGGLQEPMPPQHALSNRKGAGLGSRHSSSGAADAGSKKGAGAADAGSKKGACTAFQKHVPMRLGEDLDYARHFGPQAFLLKLHPV